MNMALQKCTLILDHTSKELQSEGSAEFPCAGYATHYTDRSEDVIPWHWHEAIEIICIESGAMTVKIPSKSFLLNAGDCLVINGNMLHYAVAAPECELHSLVFSPKLISGAPDSAFAKKYVEPLTSCASFTAYYADAHTNQALVDRFRTAFQALAEDQYGYEFVVREKLSQICLFLHQELKPETDVQRPAMHQDDLRIQKMLGYIHDHFAENLSLCDISREAGISERECLRCFRKTIQLSPIQYLLKYRVMQGAEMLKNKPGCNISEIASLCGFESQSNFAGQFKRYYNCTPREYRNRS